MNSQPSTGEHIVMGERNMENEAKKRIIENKKVKEEKKISYPDIMEKMAELDPSLVPSLSTLRRVCHKGSELKASSFNFDEIITPIYNAVKALEGDPKPRSELDGYKAVIEVQNEELDRLFEIKELLDVRVEYLVGQSKTKDETIAFLMRQLDAKDEMIAKLMEKCL